MNDGPENVLKVENKRLNDLINSLKISYFTKCDFQQNRGIIDIVQNESIISLLLVGVGE